LAAPIQSLSVFITLLWFSSLFGVVVGVVQVDPPLDCTSLQTSTIGSPFLASEPRINGSGYLVGLFPIEFRFFLHYIGCFGVFVGLPHPSFAFPFDVVFPFPLVLA
jgi:hypothetical protein